MYLFTLRPIIFCFVYRYNQQKSLPDKIEFQNSKIEFLTDCQIVQFLNYLIDRIKYFSTSKHLLKTVL